MHTGDPALIDFIRDAIRCRGPVSFAWFMEQALYHPDHGYYASGRCAIGRAGDYFTSVSVGPLFGEMLAAQFAEMWEALGRPADFAIVEQGAHHGEFAGDALAAAQKNAPEFFSVLRYQIIEPFPVLRERQRKALSSFGPKMEWRNSLEVLEPFVGLHFSNELLDAMPVHLISSRRPAAGVPAREQECEWNEKFVDWQNDEFVFVEQPIADPSVLTQARHLPARPVGYETELNLAALDWVAELSRKLIRGYILAVDYGYAREDRYASERSCGTLQCRAEHRIVASPFEEVGRADITVHVDWTSVAECAEQCGLTIHGFTDQHHFITGLLSSARRAAPDDAAVPAPRRALQTLLHPEFLGTRFQFFALGKGVNSENRLSGFRFAREPRAALGLEFTDRKHEEGRDHQ